MTTALTIRGTAALETDVPLADLNAGDLVLGLPTDDLPFRTLHRVTEPLGRHKVPFEDQPTWLERAFLAGPRVDGILVEGVRDDGQPGTPALFALDTTPVLDRVTGWAAQ